VCLIGFKHSLIDAVPASPMLQQRRLPALIQVNATRARNSKVHPAFAV
jgi:hypothetical protein